MSIYNCVTLYLGFGFKMEVCHATERKKKCASDLNYQNCYDDKITVDVLTTTSHI